MYVWLVRRYELTKSARPLAWGLDGMGDGRRISRTRLRAKRLRRDKKPQTYFVCRPTSHSAQRGMPCVLSFEGPVSDSSTSSWLRTWQACRRSRGRPFDSALLRFAQGLRRVRLCSRSSTRCKGFCFFVCRVPRALRKSPNDEPSLRGWVGVSIRARGGWHGTGVGDDHIAL